MTRLAGVLLFAILVGESAAAQERAARNLKEVPAAEQVTRISYCRGRYDVGLGDGGTRTFQEYDLAFKTDASPHGPAPARPALVPTGRVGDRAFIVFGGLEDLRRWLKPGC